MEAAHSIDVVRRQAKKNFLLKIKIKLSFFFFTATMVEDEPTQSNNDDDYDGDKWRQLGVMCRVSLKVVTFTVLGNQT